MFHYAVVQIDNGVIEFQVSTTADSKFWHRRTRNFYNGVLEIDDAVLEIDDTVLEIDDAVVEITSPPLILKIDNGVLDFDKGVMKHKLKKKFYTTQCTVCLGVIVLYRVYIDHAYFALL